MQYESRRCSEVNCNTNREMLGSQSCIICVVALKLRSRTEMGGKEQCAGVRGGLSNTDPEIFDIQKKEIQIDYIWSLKARERLRRKSGNMALEA
jgi:hypothetical protein